VPDGSDHLDRLARGTASNAAGAVIGQAAELATFAFALDRVGTVPFSVVILSQSLAQWPYLLESGIGQVVNRLLAGQRRDDWFRERTVAAVAVYAGLGAVTFVGGLLVSHLLLGPLFGIPASLRNVGARAFDFVVFGATIKMVLGFVPRALVGQTRLGTLRVVELVRSLVALAATVVLVGRGSSALPAVGLSLFIGDVAAAFIGVALLRPRRALLLGRRPPSRVALAEHWHSSKPMLAASALSLGWTKTDAVIVGVGLGPVALTTYGVVVRAYDLLRSAMELLFVGLVPSTARYLEAGDSAGVGRLYRRVLAYVAVLVWPIAITVAVFTPQVVHLWLRRGDFPDVGAAMALAMVLIVAMTPGAAAAYVFAGADVVARAVGAMVRFAPVNLAVSVALLAPLGVSAVFVGTLVATVLLLPRYLTVMTEVTGTSPSVLLAELRRPAVMITVLTAVFVAVRLARLGDAVVIGVVAVSAVAYAAAALRWAVPTRDLRRLLP